MRNTSTLLLVAVDLGFLLERIADVRSVAPAAFPVCSTAPATVPRRADLAMLLALAGVRRHFQQISENVEDRTTRDRAGGSRRVASIELTSHYPPAASRSVGIDV